MQSYTLDILKLSWGMPPYLSNISMPCMLSMGYSFSLKYSLYTIGRFKGVFDHLNSYILNFKNAKLACTANKISLTADLQSLFLT